MLDLQLTRTWLDNDFTQGELYASGFLQCVTLELPVRDGLPGSAIPDGIYPIILEPSPKFIEAAKDDAWIGAYAHQMPHIIQIPMRTLIMLHWGNLVDETDGCVLVGQRAEHAAILNSRLAFVHIHTLIKSAIQNGGCRIEVITRPKLA